MSSWTGNRLVRVLVCLGRAAHCRAARFLRRNSLSEQKREEIFVVLRFLHALRGAGHPYCLASIREKPDFEICSPTGGHRVGVEMTGLVDEEIERAVVGRGLFVNVLNGHLRTDPALWSSLTEKFPDRWAQPTLASIPPKNKREAVARLILGWLTKVPYAGESTLKPSDPAILKWVTQVELRKPVWKGFWFAQSGLGGLTGFPPLEGLLNKKRDDAAGYENLGETWLVVYNVAASARATSFAMGPEVSAAANSCLTSRRYQRVFLFDWHDLMAWEFGPAKGWTLLAAK